MPLANLPNDCLPSISSTLRHFYHNFVLNKKNERSSAIKTAETIVEIWKIIGKQPSEKYKVANKVSKIVAEYKALKRGKSKLSEKKKNKYLVEIECLFDISINISKRNKRPPPNSETTVVRNDYIQRADFQIAGGSGEDVDLVLVHTDESATAHIENQRSNIGQQDIPIQNAGASHTINNEGQPHISQQEDNTQNKMEASGTHNAERRCRQRQTLIDRNSRVNRNALRFSPDKDLCMMYSRGKISSEFAAMLYMLHAKHFEIDLSNVVCSRATIDRYRKRHQELETDRMFQEFDRNARYTLHFDGKSFRKRGITEKRVGVVVTNEKTCKTLEVATVKSSKAVSIAESVWRVVDMWNIAENILCICFDTENTNSGRMNGVVKLLTDKFGRDLLQLACRRHVYEVILKKASEETIEKRPSTSPTIPMFEKFCLIFNSSDFDRTSYDGVEEDEFFIHLLPIDEKMDLIRFCKEQLQHIRHIRNDYNELLKLIIMLLSPEDRSHYAIQAPGSYSRARFMCRIIYSIKMYLYRRQNVWLRRILGSIQRFILFCLKVYVKNWFTCSLAVCAPRNDLDFMKRLNALSIIMPNTAKSTMAKFREHLRYLSEVNVAFAFFDSEVAPGTKRKMITNLTRELNQPNKNRFQLNEDVVIEEIELDYFVSKRTFEFFEISGIPCDFLTRDPSEWFNDLQYINGQRVVSAFTVVNDAAERSIALFQRCESQANSEVRKNEVVQTVEDHRRHFPTANKQFLISKLSGN